MNISKEDLKFLDDNRYHHHTLVHAFYLRSLSAVTRETMQTINGKYWQPGYATDLWCGPCVSDMVLALYRNYDGWIAAQPKPVEPEPPGVMIPEILVPEPEPIIVAATFPAVEKELKTSVPKRKKK